MRTQGTVATSNGSNGSSDVDGRVSNDQIKRCHSYRLGKVQKRAPVLLDDQVDDQDEKTSNQPEPSLLEVPCLEETTPIRVSIWATPGKKYPSGSRAPITMRGQQRLSYQTTETRVATIFPSQLTTTGMLLLKIGRRTEHAVAALGHCPTLPAGTNLQHKSHSIFNYRFPQVIRKWVTCTGRHRRVDFEVNPDVNLGSVDACTKPTFSRNQVRHNIPMA